MCKSLYAEVEEILFRLDPVGINFGDNTDEYGSEVGTIVPRLEDASSEADVHRIVYEEFVRWFDEAIAGDPNKQAYKEAAKEIWQAWVNFSRSLA